jgi:hypothetical protein
MKSAWVVILAVAAMWAPAQPASHDESLDVAVVRLTSAIVANDAAAVRNLLAPEWKIIDAEGGIMSRDGFTAAIEKGELVHQSMRLDEADSRGLGDAAIWTGRAFGSGIYRGQAFSFNERSTSVWKKENGRWICLFTQLTSITAKNSGATLPNDQKDSGQK